MVVVKKINLICIFLISACSSSNIQVVSIDEFKKEYKNSKNFHTIKSYRLLNGKNGKVCLEKKEMSSFNKNKWNKKIICTQLDLLDRDIKKEISNSLDKSEKK